MFRHSPFIFCLVVKEIKLEYSRILMKTLEMNEQSQKNEGIYFPNYTYLTSKLPKSTKLDIKVMPRHSIFTLWVDMKRIYLVKS